MGGSVFPCSWHSADDECRRPAIAAVEPPRRLILVCAKHVARAATAARHLGVPVEIGRI